MINYFCRIKINLGAFRGLIREDWNGNMDGTRLHRVLGLEIGENSVIRTGVVVTKSIPSNCLAAGVPVKIIKRLGE